MATSALRPPRPPKKSPIKAPPLRMPGESLQTELTHMLYGKTLLWCITVLIVWLLVGLNWLQWALKAPPTLGSNIFHTVLAALVTAFVIVMFRRMGPRMKAVKQGMQGEQVVGQFLDEHVRPIGYRVYHDLLGAVFNVDHVLIGPGGIFTLETKTISKPAVGAPVVSYDSQAVLVDGMKPERDPIVQAKAAASFVRQLLAECTGRKNIFVRPVVLYPGWWIEGTSSGQEVWVLEPKTLPGFLMHEPAKLSSEDVHLFASRLAEHIRQRERQNASS